MVPPVASTSLIPPKFSNFATTSPNNLTCPTFASTSLNPSKFSHFATTSSNNLNCPTVASTSLNPSKFSNFVPTFVREPLQSPEDGVIILTDSPLASNYTIFFENQIRSVYYPSNHIMVYNNISTVCTADPYIGTTKIHRDICHYSFRFHPQKIIS